MFRVRAKAPLKRQRTTSFVVITRCRLKATMTTVQVAACLNYQSPSTALAIMLRWISLDPPYIESLRLLK